jgi:hypothetical protein
LWLSPFRRELDQSSNRIDLCALSPFKPKHDGKRTANDRRYPTNNANDQCHLGHVQSTGDFASSFEDV